MTKERRSEAIWVEARERWQINVQRDGKRKTFTSSIPGRRGKHEAEEKADEWLDAGQPEDMRFDAAWAEYLEYIRRNTSASNHKSIDSIGRNHFLDDETTTRLSKKKMSRISVKDVQNIISTAGENGLSKRTCKNIRDKFSSFLFYAKGQKWEYNIDMSHVTLPTGAKDAVRTIVQPDQLKKLFAVSTYIDHGKEKECFYIHAFRFLVITGYRRGELCGFRREDYDSPVLTVRRSINELGEETPGKNANARRANVLSRHAQKILADQEQMLKDLGIISPWLFPGPDGNRLDPKSLYGAWRKGYGKYHGIKVSLHEMRHTFISIAKLEMPEMLLKDIVGHGADMDTGLTYGHEVDGEKQRAADIIDDIFTRILSV